MQAPQRARLSIALLMLKRMRLKPIRLKKKSHIQITQSGKFSSSIFKFKLTDADNRIGQDFKVPQIAKELSAEKKLTSRSNPCYHKSHHHPPQKEQEEQDGTRAVIQRVCAEDHQPLRGGGREIQVDATIRQVLKLTNSNFG